MATDLSTLQGEGLLEFMRGLTDAYRTLIGSPNPDNVSIDGALRPTFTRWMTWLVEGGVIYQDVASGLAAVEESRFFSVVGGDDQTYLLMYQKVSGNAVLRKTITNTVFNALVGGVYDQNRLSSFTITEGYRNKVDGESQPESEPGVVASTTQSITGYIDVKKGDCYCLTFPAYVFGSHQKMVQFFDGTTPAGGIVWSMATVLGTAGDPLANRLDIKGDKNRQLSRYFRVPRDGRIRISVPTTSLAKSYLNRVSYDEFIDNHLWRLAPMNLKRPEWRDKVYSPIFAKTAQQYSGTSIQSQSNGAISELIPVKAGQYVTTVVPTDGLVETMIVFNSSQTVTSAVQRYNTLSSQYSNAGTVGGLIVNENYKVPADGFICISMRGHDYPYSDAGLILVSDTFVQWERKWLAPGDQPEKVKGSALVDMLPGSVTTDANFDCCPMVSVKQGSFVKVEFELVTAGNNINARAYPIDPVAFANGQMRRALLVTGMGANAAGATGTKYTAFYYADTVDAVITAQGKSGTLNVEIQTYEEFLADRNAVLSTLVGRNNVTGSTAGPFGGTGASGVYSVGYIPMLPYEVLQYETNYTQIAGFTGEYVFGVGYDVRYLRVPLVFLTNVTAKNTFERTVQNNGRFCWVYYQYNLNDGTFTGNGNPVLMSQDEYEKTYLDTGEEIPNGYLRDYVTRLDWDNGTLIQKQWDTTTFNNDNIRQMAPFGVIKGQCYRWKMAMGNMKQLRGPTVAYTSDTSPFYTAEPLITMGPTVLPNQISAQPMMGYFKAKEDGWIYLTTRRCGANEDPDSATGRLYDQFKQLSVELVSEETYLEETTPSSTSRMLYIADPEGLEFHMINGPMPYHRSSLVDQEYEYPVQIWQRGVKLGTYMLKTAVQGSGSTSVENIKVNIDVKLYNSKGKKVDIKLGDWQQTDKLTLKANNYDRTSNRDAIATHIWREIRRQRTFPDDRILDPQIWDKEPTFKDVRFFHDSVGSTQGVPAAVYYGGMFYGMYMLRNKKDEPNYGIVKEEPDFIWLQSDYRWNVEANGEVNFVKWGAWSWKQWEVTQPEEPDYTVGSVPTTQTTVDAVSRVFDWIEGCISDGAPTRFANEADQYLYVPSWIDYYILIELLNCQDNNDNNIILSTYNGSAATQRWTIHAYDFDSTMGWLGNPSTGHIPDNADVFRLMRQGMWSQLVARWNELRSDGSILDVKNLMHIVRQEGGKAPTRWREDDEDLWGSQDYNSVVGIQKWLADRVAYLDAYYV